jgi:hypothetical protein
MVEASTIGRFVVLGFDLVAAGVNAPLNGNITVGIRRRSSVRPSIARWNYEGSIATVSS